MNVQHRLGPTRIIVRDAQLIEGGELEYKTENVINRATGAADHPRRLERVAAGAAFELKLGLQVWDFDDGNIVSHKDKHGTDAMMEFVLDGLRSICETGLGSGVSKGSGEIAIEELRVDGRSSLFFCVNA